MRQQFLQWMRPACVVLFAGAIAPAVDAGPKNVPFQAAISFTEQVVPGVQPCAMIGVIHGTGVAFQSGPVSLASTDCINPLTPTSFVFVSNNVVLSDSKGDLRASYAGTLSSTGVITGAYVITGGTGDYENASGEGIIRGFESIDLNTFTGTGQITLKGKLSY